MIKKNPKIKTNNSYLEKVTNKFKRYKTKNNKEQSHRLTISIENKMDERVNNTYSKEYIKINSKKFKKFLSPNVKPKNYNTNINNKNLNLEDKENSSDKNYHKNLNNIQNSKTSTKKNIFKKINREINDTNKQQNLEENITKENEIKSNNYNFNIYKKITQTIQKEDELCKDDITKTSIYCLDCMVSSCPECKNFCLHQNHNYIYTYNFYFDFNKKFEECFNDIDCLFSLNPIYLEANKIKGEIKMQINSQINQIIDKLNTIKNNKLKEIDNLINDDENNVELLKNKKNEIKSKIVNILDKEKYFLNFKNDKSGYNNDFYNTSFLLRYDLLKNTEFINEQIKSKILEIKIISQNYLNKFNENIANILNLVNNIEEKFDTEFNYKIFNFEIYKPIEEKLLLYNNKIQDIKKKIYNKINHKNGIEFIKKLNKILKGNLKDKYFNLFDFEVNEKSDINNMKANDKSELINNEDINYHQIFKSLNDVCLNSKILQQFYSFEIINSLNNNFKINKKENEYNENNELYEKLIPIPETNEIQFINKKSGLFFKKNIKFNISSHKYSYFLNGSRSILINDLLYIFGGVTKENIESKTSYIYSIKTNELHALPDMINSHSYHSLYYIEKYSSILIIGGENNNSCEVYNINSNSWKNLPVMIYPKANCNIYYDKRNDIIYTFFGKVGKITENKNYLDVIECLNLREFPLEWKKIKYKNKVGINVKTDYLKILPISDDVILINGGKNRKAAYLINKKELVKFDWKMINNINSDEIIKNFLI